MRKIHGISGLVAALICMTVVSACGSSSGSSSSTASSTASSTPASSGTAKVDPSKPPVVLALNALKIQAVDLLTPYTAGAEAAAKAINAKGGIGGREVKIVTCNTMYQPATVATCAHKTLAEKPTAMIGCDPSWPTAGLPVYAKAEVPSFSCPNTPADFTNPWSFGLIGGTRGDYGSAARYLCTRADTKKVVAFLQDIPISHTTAVSVMNSVFKGCGKTVDFVYYPITGADLTPDVAKAAGLKPDFVIAQGGGALGIQVFKLFGQAGIPASKILGGSNVFAYQSVLKPAGAVMDGAYGAVEVASWDDTANADVAAYLKAMEGSGVDAQDSNPEVAYMMVMGIYTAAEKIGPESFDAASLAKFMTTANQVPVPTSRQILNPGPAGFPQAKQPFNQIVQWKDGKLNVITEGTDQGWISGF